MPFREKVLVCCFFFVLFPPVKKRIFDPRTETCSFSAHGGKSARLKILVIYVICMYTFVLYTYIYICIYVIITCLFAAPSCCKHAPPPRVFCQLGGTSLSFACCWPKPSAISRLTAAWSDSETCRLVGLEGQWFWLGQRASFVCLPLFTGASLMCLPPSEKGGEDKDKNKIKISSSDRFLLKPTGENKATS